MKKILTVLLLILIFAVSAFAADSDVFYVADGGTGNGSSAALASSSLADAYNALTNGGTVVVCGDYTISSVFNKIAHNGKIIITSVFGGIDYRQKNDAELIFASSMYLGGETEFCDITLTGAASYPIIYVYNQVAVFGNGIVCEKNDNAQYPSIIGGLYKAQNSQSSTITINSGTWQRVRGGPGAGGSTNYTVDIVFNGGTFVETVILGSSRPTDGSGSHDGDITAVINGGIFRQGLVAASLAEGDTLNSNINITINDGVFYSKLGVSATDIGSYSGSFNVTINGGEFAHLTEFVGPANLRGTMTSSLAGTVDFTAKETGTYTLQNPIRNDGADPWLFYHDGYYYYTSTTTEKSMKR